jgi:hypothetical protein
MIEPMQKETRAEALRVLREAPENNSLDWALIHMARVVLKGQEGSKLDYDKNYAKIHIDKLSFADDVTKK